MALLHVCCKKSTVSFHISETIENEFFKFCIHISSFSVTVYKNFVIK